MSRAVTVHRGGGVGTLEAGEGQGQGEHLQGGTDRTGPGTPEPWWGRELRRRWRAVFVALVSPLGLATTARAPPPKKKILGELMGLNTGTIAILGLNSGTGLSTGTGALHGLNLEAEDLLGHDKGTTALLGLDVESGALSGVDSGTASIGATGEAGG